MRGVPEDVVGEIGEGKKGALRDRITDRLVAIVERDAQAVLGQVGECLVDGEDRADQSVADLAPTIINASKAPGGIFVCYISRIILMILGITSRSLVN